MAAAILGSIQSEFEIFVAAESTLVQTSLGFGSGTEIKGRFACILWKGRDRIFLLRLKTKQNYEKHEHVPTTEGKVFRNGTYF